MKTFRIKVKEVQVAEYVVQIDGDVEDLTKEGIFSNGKIVDTINDGNGEVITEEVVSCVEVRLEN